MRDAFGSFNNTFEDALVYQQGQKGVSFSMISPFLWFRPAMDGLALTVLLLHQVSKQGIVFIELSIIDLAIIQFFHQDFIVRFALQLDPY